MISTKKNYDVVVDSSAWVEYFIGSDRGKQAASYIDHNELITPVVVIAELSALYARRCWPKLNKHMAFIQEKSLVAELTFNIAINAGRTRQYLRDVHKGASLADAIICETAKSFDVPVLTCDKHFEGLQKVIFLK